MDIWEVSLYLGDEDLFLLEEGERPNSPILILTIDPSILFMPYLSYLAKSVWAEFFISYSFLLRMAAGFFISRVNLLAGHRFHHMSDATIYGNNRGVDLHMLEVRSRFDALWQIDWVLKSARYEKLFMGLLKKTASGVLAIFPCSRTPCTLRAQKWLWPCCTDFFEPTRNLWHSRSLCVYLPMENCIIPHSLHFSWGSEAYQARNIAKLPKGKDTSRDSL